MESRYSLQIAPGEWRWVILLATGLVFLAFAPFIWVALSGTNQWQFMGALHNYQDGATYLSKMVQGGQGHWLIRFQHTSEDQSAAFLQVIYPLLGQIAHLAHLPQIVMFHVARVAAALFMYIALYHLAASIWMRVRTRRIFFVVCSLGAGFGWLFAPLFNTAHIPGSSTFPDLAIPEAYPFFSTLSNVHFPLTIGCLALLAGILIHAFRPGADRLRELDATALPAGALSFALALLYPQALIPIGVALALYVLLLWQAKKRLDARPLRWLLAVVLPAAPVAAYYAAIVANIPAFAEWTRQNVTPAPAPWIMALGFGLPLILALPGLIRAARRFEQTDDRFMLLWLVAITVTVYLPTAIQRRFAVGAMIPIAYFATRSLEDFWFQRVSRRYRIYLAVAALPLMSISLILSLFLPVLPAVTGNPDRSVGIFLERDYTVAFRWLELSGTPNDVVLASPVVSTWIPAWAGERVVYGHPFETLDAAAKKDAVLAWYGATSADACGDLLTRYKVHFVLVGPEEMKLGPAVCAEPLRVVATIGQVTIYAL